MKVTSEMVARAVTAWSESRGEQELEDALGAVLEAALAPLPEPDELQRRIEFTAERWAIETRAEEARADAAEAKLAEVRAWADGHSILCCVDKLKAILDGAPCE